LRVPWLVGCDGAHSTVRHLLGIPFDGKAFEEFFTLADVRLETTYPSDEISVSFLKGDILALFPMPGDKRFRIVVGRHEAPAPGSEPALAEFQAALDASGLAGGRVSDPVWMSNFRISQRQVALKPARKIGAFREVAAMATPGQIGRIVAAAVLLGHNVFDVEGVWLVVLVDAAIFAPRAGLGLDQASHGGIHHVFLARRRRALACRMAIRVPTET